jgi:hypothetical protein
MEGALVTGSQKHFPGLTLKIKIKKMEEEITIFFQLNLVFSHDLASYQQHCLLIVTNALV